ncbi:MAG: SDR family oxidoreductase [Carboxylicivirga sp.]|jgi:pteridine reductase|nr:SDR family oxidoreductase [Carboxylicivirga sp.]
MSKRVLITGAARRIGHYLTNHFASLGYDVILHVNNSMDEACNLLSSLKHKYPKQQFEIFKHDLRNWKELSKATKVLFSNFGVPNVVIHNASYYLEKNLINTSEDDMEAMMAIHLFSPMILGREMRKNGITGDIISILDTAIGTNESHHGMYLLAKKSLADYTRMAALEWAPALKVNAIAPGPVLPVEAKSDAHFNKVVGASPLKKQVDLESISSSIDYLIANKNISGQIIYCDSGQHLL